jgi:hypothetical protein
MLPERFRRFLPDPHTLRDHPALRWMGPTLRHPRLWRVNRRGIAMGLAIGVFFGLLMPVAQILFSVLAALVLRANIPAAVGSTLITNPITFAPVYYAAYHLGSWMLGRSPASAVDLERGAARTATGLALWMDRLAVIGAPLALGLLTLAVSLSVLIYFAVHWAWRLRIVRAWQRRRARRHPH